MLKIFDDDAATDETALSLRAAVATLDVSGIGENGVIAILRRLKETDRIVERAFTGPSVTLCDLNAATKAALS